MNRLLPANVISKLNPASALLEISIMLKVELNLLKAFFKVANLGKHFNEAGRVTIKFDLISFKKHSKKYKEKDWKDIKHENQQDEYKSFLKAVNLDRVATFNSIRMGSILMAGNDCKRYGFETAEAMYNAFRKSPVEAIVAFGDFIRSDKKLHKACQKKDYHNIAKLYSDKSYKKYGDAQGRNYADRIEQQYNLLLA